MAGVVVDGDAIVTDVVLIYCNTKNEMLYCLSSDGITYLVTALVIVVDKVSLLNDQMKNISNREQ